MRNTLIRILLIACIGLAGCSSTASTRLKVNPGELKPSQTTNLEIEEIYITDRSLLTDSSKGIRHIDPDRRAIQSTAKHPSIRASSDPLNYFIAAMVICTIELILLDECMLPHFGVHIYP
ncbi:MAG: hypothetical protein V4660_00315 [Pseudomonadota bacterium]